MNASAKIPFPTTAFTVSAVVSFFVVAVLLSPPDLFTLLLISAIAAFPFAVLLVVSYLLVRRKRIPHTTAAAIGAGLAIGISSVLMGAMIVRYVFPHHPTDENRAAQQGAAGNGSMVVCCESERVLLAVARA